MLSTEERIYFEKLIDLENCVAQHIINLKRKRNVKSYKELYELRADEHKLIETAKDKLAEYEPADILRIMGIRNTVENPDIYQKKYQRVKVFFRSLYGNVKTVRTVERCGFYLNLLKKQGRMN